MEFENEEKLNPMESAGNSSKMMFSIPLSVTENDINLHRKAIIDAYTLRQRIFSWFYPLLISLTWLLAVYLLVFIELDYNNEMNWFCMSQTLLILGMLFSLVLSSEPNLSLQFLTFGSVLIFIMEFVILIIVNVENYNDAVDNKNKQNEKTQLILLILQVFFVFVDVLIFSGSLHCRAIYISPMVDKFYNDMSIVQQEYLVMAYEFMLAFPNQYKEYIEMREQNVKNYLKTKGVEYENLDFRKKIDMTSQPKTEKKYYNTNNTSTNYANSIVPINNRAPKNYTNSSYNGNNIAAEYFKLFEKNNK